MKTPDGMLGRTLKENFRRMAEMRNHARAIRLDQAHARNAFEEPAVRSLKGFIGHVGGTSGRGLCLVNRSAIVRFGEREIERPVRCAGATARTFGANKILSTKLQGKKRDVGITLIFLGEPNLFV